MVPGAIVSPLPEAWYAAVPPAPLAGSGLCRRAKPEMTSNSRARSDASAESKPRSCFQVSGSSGARVNAKDYVVGQNWRADTGVTESGGQSVGRRGAYAPRVFRAAPSLPGGWIQGSVTIGDQGSEPTRSFLPRFRRGRRKQQARRLRSPQMTLCPPLSVTPSGHFVSQDVRDVRNLMWRKQPMLAGIAVHFPEPSLRLRRSHLGAGFPSKILRPCSNTATLRKGSRRSSLSKTQTCGSSRMAAWRLARVRG